jgi:hypothetical protein
MAKIEPTTVAIAAAAAYFLLRPKDANAAPGDEPDQPDDGECPPGYQRTPFGTCVPTPSGEFEIPLPDDAFPTDATPFDANVNQGFAPGPDAEPKGPGGFAALPGDPAQPLPPAVDYAALVEGLLNPDGYPQQGTLYQVKQGDTFKKITAQALADAAYSAAIAKGATAAQASELSQAAFNSGSMRAAYRDLILCSPFNDYLYGTNAYPPGVTASGLTGRAIRLRPKQFDNLSRLAAGEPPARNEKWGTPADQNKGGKNPVFAGQNKYELLWLPGLNLTTMVNVPTFTLGTLETLDYPNSEWTTVVPPPVLWELGILDYDDQNAPGSVGCGYYEADIGP